MTSWTSQRRSRPDHLGAACALLFAFLALTTIAVVTRNQTTVASTGRPTHSGMGVTPAPSSPAVTTGRPEHHTNGNLLLTLPIIGIGAILFFAWGDLERTLGRRP